MEKENVTRINTIHLLGFQTQENVKFFMFFLFFITFCFTLCGNVLIIVLVSYNKILHSPMYFFLSQLSLTDILLASDIIPNLLQSILVRETIISLSDCLSQFYFFCVAEIFESLLLTLMSYDRYLAICKPLHYSMIMNHQCCCIFITTCWTLSILISLVYPLTISKLQFCGPNVIDHFFCDLDPILKLSCSDTAIVQLQVILLSLLFAVIPFVIIIVSYVYIIVTVFEIPSITGRQKVFSTCSSQLAVVSIYYGTTACVYMVPSKGQSLNVRKVLSLPYTVLTPLMNPIIYTLRNKDLKNAVKKAFNKLLLCILFINKNRM
ncbi:PREDICTED: olfactory receptor 24-like [Nanorana parkeri]|uniref:olfactory receptor 24-like n=1 Tax=Nanorana parkeri TaxID=125878 RepID=UPI000854ECDA|nr:PREDICTED: olfactory receptor 24-like [Nanorana parkeri]